MGDAPNVSDSGERLVPEGLLADVLFEVNDIIWCASADSQRLLYLNRPGRRLTGRGLDGFAVEGAKWVESIHPDDRGSFENALEQLQPGREVSLEYRVVDDQQQVRWLDDRIRCLTVSGDASPQIVGIARDATEAKLSEREIRDAQASFSFTRGESSPEPAAQGPRRAQDFREPSLLRIA